MTRFSFLRHPVVALTAGLAVLGWTVGPACGQNVRSGSVWIGLSASPTSLPADGKSKSRIRIELRDRSDRAMPNGTAVFCHAEGGVLETTATDRRESLTVTTRGGFATVYCTSQTPGLVTVTVRVQDSRNQVGIQFFPQGEGGVARSRVVHVRGGWVGYCPELGIIRARDGARVQFGNLMFDAGDGVEIAITEQTMRGWGVRVKRRGEELAGEDFYFQFASGQGVLRRFGDLGVEWVNFGVYGLRGSARGREIPDDAFRSDDREGTTWLVCKTCSFFIGEKVVVKPATLYAQGQKVFSFPPYWVVGLAGYSGASNTQVLGISTDGGLGVDFPFFYRVTDVWAGSIKLQRGAGGTSFVARDGWNIGVAEEYDTGNVKGAVEARGLFSSDWGLEWRDERSVFGANQGYFNVAWPDHRNLFSDASIYHYSESYRFSLRGQFDKPHGGNESYGVVADWLTEPRQLTSNSDYRLGTSVGGRRRGDESSYVLQNELYGALDFSPWRIGKQTKIRPSIDNVYSWDTADYSANAMRGDLRLTRQIGLATRLGLDYSLVHRSGNTSRPGIAHLVGMDLNMAGGTKWNAYMNGSWDITADETYGFLSLDYYVKPRWRLGLMGTHYDFAAASFNDLEFELGRAIGNREIALSYSLEAGRIALELGGLGFTH
jgi:hypothetical protein